MVLWLQRWGTWAVEVEESSKKSGKMFVEVHDWIHTRTALAQGLYWASITWRRKWGVKWKALGRSVCVWQRESIGHYLIYICSGVFTGWTDSSSKQCKKKKKLDYCCFWVNSVKMSPVCGHIYSNKKTHFCSLVCGKNIRGLCRVNDKWWKHDIDPPKDVKRSNVNRKSCNLVKKYIY